MIDLARWLAELGLAQYAAAFAANDIDGDVVAELTDADLQSLGVSLGHRRKLLRALAAVREGAAPDATSAPSRMPAPAATRASAPADALAERRHLTVMFCDLVGSTALATRLDPEECRVVIRNYQVACTDAITRFGGTVAKYLGDGVLAYFGYPHAHEDDAERAVRAGIAIVGAARAVDNGLGEPVHVRVGVASGLVVVGDAIGDGPSREQAVVGETPNLAARLQAIAAPDSVVIATATRDLLGGRFALEPLGAQALAGIDDPVPVWRVAGELDVETRFGAAHRDAPANLVGRNHELELLVERWERARGGEGQLVLLGGVPGIGKSRLAVALRERLPRDEVHVVQYQCSPHHLMSPLHPVIQQLARAAGFAAEDTAGVRLAKLGRLADDTPDSEPILPLLAALLSLPLPDDGKPLDLPPDERRRRTLATLAAMFERLAARRPVLLILEDAHWIDPTTRDLMDTLIERAASLRALVLVTHRPEFQSTWAAHAHATVLALNRLGRGACERLVTGVAHGLGVPTEVIEQIVKRTDGVPLFVEELTKSVLESGQLAEHDGRLVLRGALDAAAIPATLQDSLMARLDRLRGAKDVAQIASAVGRRFPYALIAALAPGTTAQLDAALVALRESDIVLQRGTPPDATYVFKHALIQDAAYESMLRSQRRQIHERIAAAIEAGFPAIVEGEPEVLADHLTRASAHARATAAWLGAGQRALARSSSQEALQHLTAALAALERAPDLPDAAGIEIDIQVGLGAAWIAARGYSAAETEAAYMRARTLLDPRPEDPRRCAVLHGLAMLYVNRAQPGRALAIGEDILPRRAGGDRLSQLVGRRVIAVACNFMGRFTEARRHAGEAAALYDIDEHRGTATRFGHDMGVGANWHLAIACRFLGDRTAADAAEAQAWALTRALDNATTSLYSALWAAFTRLATGDAEEAARIAQAMVAEARDRGMALWTAYGRQLLGSALIAAGRWEDGLCELQEGTAEAERVDNAMLKLMALRFEAEALARLGDAPAALAVADEARRHVEARDERWWEPEVRRIRGEIVAQIARDPGAGTDDIVHALAAARKQQSAVFSARAEAALVRIGAARA